MSQVAVTLGLWESVCLEFEKIFPPDTYATWFGQLKARCDGDEHLVLLAPNEFAAIWIEDNYLDLIRDKINVMGGSPIEVTVEVTEAAPVTMAGGESDATSVVNRTFGTLDGVRLDGRSAGSAESAKSNGRKPCILNPRNTFENFIVGPSNQLAHAAATAVAAEPGHAYNPLFIYGDSGLGKTHLMQSIAHTIIAQNPKAHVVYLSCEKFTNKFLQAIRDNKLEDFRRYYRKVDVLIIDDIQFLEGKERTQAEFFHTFNELFESQRQLCLSSDRPASEIAKLESRLVSRFMWGMVTDIQPPDLETRVAIMRKKAMSMANCHLSNEVLEFLATRITRNVRRMEGALNKVATFARLSKHPLDVATAERLVKDLLVEETQQQITIEKIQRKVVEYYDLRLSDMSSKRRPNHIAFPRQVAMYLSRVLTSQPLKEIGEAFGGRDHGTVIHACKSVENMMEQDETIRRAIDFLTKQIAH